jgi:hypothetical protein
MLSVRFGAGALTAGNAFNGPSAWSPWPAPVGGSVQERGVQAAHPMHRVVQTKPVAQVTATKDVPAQ